MQHIRYYICVIGCCQRRSDMRRRREIYSYSTLPHNMSEDRHFYRHINDLEITSRKVYFIVYVRLYFGPPPPSGTVQVIS
jgi:hypothetical protein